MNIFDPIPLCRTLSVMPTFQCTAACKHCGTLSNPQNKTRLSLEEIYSVIDQAHDNGYKLVVFTGGEATLVGKDLLCAIRKASSLGFFVRLVTNAHWAISDRKAQFYMNELVESGLTEINFSTGDQHTRFVPLENVIRATYAAVKKKLNVAIMVEHVKERVVTKETVEDHTEFKRIFQEFPTAKINVHESPWMPLSPHEISTYSEGIMANRSNLASYPGCDSVLSTTTIQADGKIGACCGLGMRLIPELHLGTIYETKLADADEKAANDFLKRWIHIEGPEHILAWASKYDSDIKWEDMYAHKCQACIRLYKDPKVRKVIGEHHKEKIADVLFGQWLVSNYSLDAQNSKNLGTQKTDQSLTKISKQLE